MIEISGNSNILRNLCKYSGKHGMCLPVAPSISARDLVKAIKFNIDFISLSTFGTTYLLFDSHHEVMEAFEKINNYVKVSIMICDNNGILLGDIPI